MPQQKTIDDLLGLVRDSRLRPSDGGPRTPLIASESDKGRIVNSAAFRRLQQKAQVFPLDSNASVRTRLTHSIEVSQLGRYLAQRVIAKLGASGQQYEKLAALVNVVENACLLHDIGNPPFGHLGESAIREWFESSGGAADLSAFDGNPQGFRLISLLSGRDNFGMNLTLTLLLSTVKYPWTKSMIPQGERKAGVFDMEWSTYEKACVALGWTPGKRFPFVFLMEAADDIAYSMSDLEDGLEKKIIRVSDLEKAFGKERFNSASLDPIVKFKTDVTNIAIESAAEAFVMNLDNIMAGDGVRLLTREGGGKLLEEVKQFAVREIYSHPSAERVELAGRQVIAGMLEHFHRLLKLERDEFIQLLEGKRPKDKNLDFQLRLLRLLPPAYCDKYKVMERGRELERRAHLIVDFIAGMTDDYALQTYQVLQGIRIQ